MDALHQRPVRLGHATADLPHRAITEVRLHHEGVARDLASQYQINAAAFGCDITDGAAVENLVAAVTARFGRLDILINDAAFNKSVPFQDLDGLTIDLWEKIMAVNLTGPMRLIKAAAPALRASEAGRPPSTTTAR